MYPKMTHSIQSLISLQYQAASLLVYQSVLETEIGQTFVQLLHALVQNYRTPEKSDVSIDCLQLYGRWFKALARQGQSWQDYLFTQILASDNPFTQQAQHRDWQQLPASLVAAVRHDLQVLQGLAACRSEDLQKWVRAISPTPLPPIDWQIESDDIEVEASDTRRLSAVNTFKEHLKQLDRWEEGLAEIADYHQQFGVGQFAQYDAFRWQSGALVGIAHPDRIRLQELAAYEFPKRQLIQNTEFFLQGHQALNVLLYGSRGSGKSSLVKSLLWEYADRGLRLVEVAKSELIHLSEIVELLRDSPQKFIIFVDDLSFEEDNEAFKSLKVVLEGNLTARPQNIIVYATSNRRHLVREFFDDRPDPKDSDEVHAWDTVQEKLSFSDRFGLTLTFEATDQATYLEIVRHLATHANLSIKTEDLDFRALQWATRRNGRSGRTARQFIDALSAELSFSRAVDFTKR